MPNQNGMDEGFGDREERLGGSTPASLPREPQPECGGVPRPVLGPAPAGPAGLQQEARTIAVVADGAKREVVVEPEDTPESLCGRAGLPRGYKLLLNDIVLGDAAGVWPLLSDRTLVYAAAPCVVDYLVRHGAFKCHDDRGLRERQRLMGAAVLLAAVRIAAIRTRTNQGGDP